MRVEIITPEGPSSERERVVRALLINDGYEPVEVSRNAFVGPHVSGPHAVESVEPTVGGPDEPLTLQPFSFYGRERSLTLPPGESEIVAAYRDGGDELTARTRVVVE
jgi:hypothetical protein